MTAGRRFAPLAVVVATVITGSMLPAGAASLKGRLLTLSDMPTGWTVTESSGASAAASIPCLSGFHEPTKHGTRRTVSYVNGSTTEFEEGLATGPGELARWRKLHHNLSACHHVTVTDQGKSLGLTIAPMSFPSVSRTSSAYSMTTSVTGINVGFDLVLFRTEKDEGFVIYGTLGNPDASTVVAFAKEATAKAEGKAVSPPSTTSPS